MLTHHTVIPESSKTSTKRRQGLATICLHCPYPRHLSTGLAQPTLRKVEVNICRWRLPQAKKNCGSCILTSLQGKKTSNFARNAQDILESSWICLYTWLTQCSTQKLVNHGKPSSDFDNHSDVCQTAGNILAKKYQTEPVHAACLSHPRAIVNRWKEIRELRIKNIHPPAVPIYSSQLCLHHATL